MVPSKLIGTRSVRLDDALRRCPHPPLLHVKGDAEVLTDDHPRGDDLHRVAPVGEHFGDGRGVVETDLVDHDDRSGRLGRAGEHVLHVADVGHAFPDPPRPLRPGAGRDDDVIGMTGGDRVDRGVDAALDRHPVAPALVDLVADHVAELGPIGHARRQPDLPARGVVALENCDAVTTSSGGDCRLQAAGT